MNRPLRRREPDGLPAWLSGAGLNEWVEIAGSASTQGDPVDPETGWCIRGTEVWSLCPGGHGDSNYNGVVMMDLSADAPTWVTRSPESATHGIDRAYEDDGKPASRHTYQHNFWIPSHNRFMMIGQRSTWPNSSQNPTVDGFNPDNDTWDSEPNGAASNPWPNTSLGYFGAVRDARNDNVWTTHGSNFRARWNAADGSFSVLGALVVQQRWPQTWDSTRNQIFCLQWGDGQGFDSGLRASKIDPDTDTQTAITFNSSSAYTQFLDDQPQYAAMEYDAPRDRFLFFSGASYNSSGKVADTMTRIFVITPNSGSAWDMSLLALGPGTVTPEGTPAGAAGIQNRFKIIPELGGIVMLPKAGSNCYFMRIE